MPFLRESDTHLTLGCATQFHVDKLSSAHIYLRLRDGETWEYIPESLLTDLAQLTKANSIEGKPVALSIDKGTLC